MKEKLIKEEWRPVRDYEGLYEVSNFGRIRSLKFGKTKVLKPGKRRRGYLFVTFLKNSKKKHHSVHRLVFEAFNGKIPDGFEVNHIDENPSNNRLDNLNLMTHKENVNWGTAQKRRAEKQKGQKRCDVTERLSKPVVQSTLDGVFIKVWSSTMECGRNGFSNGDVSLCCNGKYKQHKGYIWQYADDFLNSLPII